RRGLRFVALSRALRTHDPAVASQDTDDGVRQSSTPPIKARTRMHVNDLRPSDRNPRSISPIGFENLKRSLQRDREFLEARPLLVNSYPGRENVVIGGNMRLRAAQDLGWDEIPVVVVS